MTTQSTATMIDTGIYRLGALYLMAASNFGGLRIMARRKTAETIPIAVNKAFHTLTPTPSTSQQVLISTDTSTFTAVFLT